MEWVVGQDIHPHIIWPYGQEIQPQKLPGWAGGEAGAEAETETETVTRDGVFARDT